MAAPIAPHEIPYLAESKHPKGALSPDLSGSKFSLGTLTLLNINSPVALALNDHLL